MSRAAGTRWTAARELLPWPRGDRRSTEPPALDPGMPVLICRVGSYPLHSGTVGVIRSLGRAGVRVHAVTESRYTPAARSRYLAGRAEFASTGREDERHLLDLLASIISELPAKPLLICTDDEAAVLVAEGADALEAHAHLPAVRPSLPRRLASKRGLYELCRQFDVPTPTTEFPACRDELAAVVGEMGLPVVVKNIDPWIRLTSPVVGGSTVVSTAADLDRLLLSLEGQPGATGAVVQQYLPKETSEDWFADGYCTDSSDVAVLFTGRKLRSWPPRTGAAASARVEANDEIASLVRSLCKRVGYCGIFDLDWRFDRRTGTYHLLDFNPRVGAQFRMFEDDAGIDVVRAMHLDLSGRKVPAGRVAEGERYVVENLALAARPYYRGTSQPLPPVPDAPRRLRLSWWAFDDPLPVVAMIFSQLASSLRSRRRRHRQQTAGALGSGWRRRRRRAPARR